MFCPGYARCEMPRVVIIQVVTVVVRVNRVRETFRKKTEDVVGDTGSNFMILNFEYLLILF